MHHQLNLARKKIIFYLLKECLSLSVVFVIDKVLYERRTQTTCITSNKEIAIKACEQIDGDYNVNVWIDGEFSNFYMDMNSEEIMKIY